MKPARSVALARYAVAGNVRTPYTWVGAFALVAMALLGAYSSARAGNGWAVDFRFLFDGGLLAAMFAVRSGLIAQRTGGLQAFLRANLVSPAEHLAGAILSLLASWLMVCAGVFLLTWLLPGGGIANAAWNAAVFGLRTGLLLPFVIVAESVSAIELPFFLPALAYLLLLLALVIALGEIRAIAILAPPVQAGDFASTLPALLRFALVVPTGFGAVLLVTAVRARRR